MIPVLILGRTAQWSMTFARAMGFINPVIVTAPERFMGMTRGIIFVLDDWDAHRDAETTRRFRQELDIHRRLDRIKIIELRAEDLL